MLHYKKGHSNTNSCQHLLSTYYVPSTVLHVLHVRIHLIVTTLRYGEYSLFYQRGTETKEIKYVVLSPTWW